MGKKSDVMLTLEEKTSEKTGCKLIKQGGKNDSVNPITRIYPSSFKLPLCWLHSPTPVTSLSMLPGIRSLAVAIHLQIHKV